EDPLAEQRPGVEPAQMLTERSHTSRNQDGGPAVPIRWSGQGADVPKRSSSRDLRRQRAIQDQCRGLFSRSSMREQRADHGGYLTEGHIEDNRAVQAGQTFPVRGGPPLSLVFADPHEGERVAPARIGERYAGIRRGAESCRDARDDLESDPLLV